ncbi:uncharacterized protein C1orf87 [Polypterus senegalus]|uniref:uncharacterized protein C1orf87 n=1 Tax=Polypterus senegalus TaxID=55291 RepID=UPI0019669136|nr:uncharacterized protein C1orf87 [Polypterus senegalus]
MAAARDAPFGTDATPEVIVKIIGSKHVKYFVEKPKRIKVGGGGDGPEKLKPHPCHGGTAEKQQEPPSQVIPLCSAPLWVVQARLGPSDVQCVTAPTGDRSLSYIHGQKKVPVGDHSSTWLQDDPKTEAAEETTGPLRTIVRNELQKCSKHSLKRVQEELAALDSAHSGLAHPSRMSLLLLRHKVPLSLPTLRLLFHTFAEHRSPEQVYYKELIDFLITAANEDLHLGATPREGLDCVPTDGIRQVLELDSKRKQHDAQLAHLLRRALADLPKWVDLALVWRSLLEADVESSGQLPVTMIKEVCQKHGLPVSSELLDTLLNSRTLATGGMTSNWLKFVELVQAALPEEGTVKDLKESENPDDENNKDLHQAREEHGLDRRNDVALPSQLHRFSKSTGAVRDVRLRNPAEPETWLQRFNKLEMAMDKYDHQKTGSLDKHEARRLIHNYNLILDLKLSPLKIDQALQNFQSGGRVSLEPLLQYLKEL